MRYLRHFSILLIFAGLLPLAGAVPWRPARPRRARGEGGRPDPDAAAILAQALQALDPERIPTLETAIWQQVHLPDLDFEVGGRYLLGPNHCYRLELQTTSGTRTGTVLQVCDGVSLWQGLRTAPGRWQEVRHAPQDQALAAPVLPLAPVTAAGENSHRLIFSGVHPLLRTLQERLVWTRHETIPHPPAPQVTGGIASVACFRLTGEWRPDLLAALAPPDNPWPEGLPCQCRLWLDTRSFWPRRVEWLGPAGPGTDPVVLAEMELRGEVLNVPMSAERCAAEFHFDPGQTPVTEVGVPAPPPNLLAQSARKAPPAGPR